ncbi:MULTISPECIES: PAS domain-containing protein [Cyanophyceae]|uniref:PAS domain-containing protein n=1 Tax=Cyanophyceae TaxID=3028117 RepID=UPI0016878B9F|nr:MULTISPECIES: PAS domain-containing protein [Cyanophyceae]MBD1917536.1 PAS domain-containing protein [Phormidium sp. FACHB-77]MBD2029589.1 PAS domain-containing protein [Phormidium sp. FACHB-322]MBD2050850.1 PAS domain-containing protein [Leptolyngbya sp. FACHB-60]
MTSPERTVLLVSSSPGQADRLRPMLQHEATISYRVVEAPCDRPISQDQLLQVDGILLDLHLSDGDGVDRLKQLRPLGGEALPIVVVGEDDLKTAVAILKAGAADYLVRDQLTPEALGLALEAAIFRGKATRIAPESLSDRPTPSSSQPPYAALAAALPQIVWTADRTGAINYWNQRWYEYTGLSAAESLTGGNCLHPHEYDPTLVTWTEAIAAGQTFAVEHRLRRHDGIYRWVMNRGVPTRDPDGQIVSWVGTMIDIDDQKHLEERLQLVVQAVNGLVFDVSEVRLEGEDRVYRSEQLFNLIGVPADEAPPTSRWWEDRIHPDDRARVRHRIEELFASSSQLYESGYRIRHQDGRWVDVWERGCLVRDAQGQVVRVVGSTVDISQQQAALRDRNQAELRLRKALIQLESALSAGSVYTWCWSIRRNRVVANRSFAQLFGLDPERVAAGVRLEKFITIIHPDDRARVAAAIDQAIATRESCTAEFRICNPQGEERWVIARGQAEYDSEGNAVIFPGALADISDRKRIEIALEQKNQEAEASQRTLDALMAYIPEGITIADAPDVRVRQISRYGQQLIGRPLEELEGLPATAHPEAWKVFALDGSPAAPEALPLTRAVQQGEVVTNEEWRLQTAAGQSITLLCNAGPIYNQEGTITGGIIAWRDITEFKETEIALQRHQQHLILAMAAARMGSWDWDIQLDAVQFSDNVKRLFGLDPEHCDDCYATVMAMVHPDDLPRVERALHDAVYGQAEYNIELRVMRPDGTVCWILSLGRVFYSAMGVPLTMTGINIDITDRKQAQLTLQQTTERLNVALKSAPISLFNQDLDLRYTWVYNPTHDLTKDQVIGQRDEDLASPETAAQLTYLKRQVIATGVSLREEVKVVANGHVAYYDLTIDPIYDDQNAIVGVTCAAVDISERLQIATERQQATMALQESEDCLRMAIESANMGIWDLNISTNQLTWDAGCKAIFGLPPEADSSMERFYEGLHPDDRDRLRQIIAAAFNQESGGNYDVEYRVIGLQDRVERWVRAKGQAYFDGDGTPLRFTGTILDITQQKQAEVAREQLLRQEQAAREAAERANRIKDEFLAILSHELRSPLNPILGWAKLLQTKKLDAEKTTRALETIERNAKLQTQLIDDLLDIAKILRGKLKIEPASVDPTFVIEAAIETVQAAADAKAIRIQTDLPDIGPIQGDGARIQQIVWNLLTNAIKFTPEQGQITIQLTQVDRWAQLKVIDTGQGIRPEFLPHIFESFRQADASITRQFGGLGLGLAIVRYLAEAHGGTISADSPGEGKGATFTVSLPLLSYRPSHRALPVLSSQIDLTGVRVIAVDDNPDGLALLTLLLGEYGAEVIGLESAAEVLSTLASFQPHVLVSDIGMPGMDGYELLRQIRALPPEQGGQVPAIALTAYVREEDSQKALDSGFQRHLSKPIEPDAIARAVAQLVS